MNDGDGDGGGEKRSLLGKKSNNYNNKLKATKQILSTLLLLPLLMLLFKWKGISWKLEIIST